MSLKKRSVESSSRTYQKYWAMGMMKDPTTRMESRAVYFPVGIVLAVVTIVLGVRENERAMREEEIVDEMTLFVQ